MTWPGAAFIVTAEDATTATKAVTAAIGNMSDETIDLDHEPKLGLAYRVRVLSGAEDDLRPLAQKLNEKLIEKPGSPIVVEHDELLRLLKDAQAFPRLNLISHPVATGRGRKSVTVADTATFAVPVEMTAADGTTTLFEQSREHGWRLTMQPESVGIESLRLRVDNCVSRLNHDASAKVRFPNGEEKLIPGLDLHHINTTVEFKNGQHVVFPITKVPNADSQDVMLVAMQACLVVLEETPQRPEPTPIKEPVPSVLHAVGVNSNSGVVGEVVLEKPNDSLAMPPENAERIPAKEFWPAVKAWLTILGPIPEGNIAEVRVEGNRWLSTDEFIAMIKSKRGEPIDEAQIRKDVRAAYATRRFMSVTPRFEKTDNGPVLVFRVLERSVIERVEFSGNKLIATADLEKVAELREGSPFDMSICGEAARRLTDYYRSNGFSRAIIRPKFEQTKGGALRDYKVIFVIVEGTVRKVQPPLETQQPAGDGAKLQLDSLGQLVWQHGSWFVVVRPESGRKLIDSGKAPSQFHSDGPVRLMLTKLVSGTSHTSQLVMTGDEWRLTSEEAGLKMQLSGDVRLIGQGIFAKSELLTLTLPWPPTDANDALDLTLRLSGNVKIRSNRNDEQSELSTGHAIFSVKGTALSRLGISGNGFVGILREPPNRDDVLIRARQTDLGMAKAEKLVSVHFDHVPLKEAIKQLAQSTGRNIMLEKPGLEEEGLTEQEPITLSLDDVKLRSALKLILDPLKLGYHVEESGVILVTSQQRLKGKAMVVTYAVADLVVPNPKRIGIKLTTDLRVTNEEPNPHNLAKPMPSHIQELINFITSCCQLNSWEAVGGNGQIKANDSTLSLVVRQTQDVHDEIRGLLEQLRRRQDIQASLHMETLTVPADFWQQIGKDFDDPAAVERATAQSPDKSAPRSIARLTKKEAALLRSLSQPESAPKVTLFNGQELEVFFGGEPPKMRLGLKPVVSADHQMLRLQAAATKPDAELDFAKLAGITLESGHSLLLDVTEVYSGGPTVGAPTVLKAFAQEDRLYKVTRQSDRRLLLITGTVVIADEEEVQQPHLGIPK